MRIYLCAYLFILIIKTGVFILKTTIFFSCFNIKNIETYFNFSQMNFHIMSIMNKMNDSCRIDYFSKTKI